MSIIVGIDLGTTNSAVGHLSPNGPRLLPNALGDVLTPSVVGLDEDGRLLVGKPARELQTRSPDRCAALFKRYMGTDWTVQLAERTFTPEELSSLVLRTLKEDAEAALGEPVERAVITVPAYFNDRQRKATIQAGHIAGFKVERIFNEPTAAALAYGFHESRDDRIVLIFDLGGGTFDVSIVELFEGALEVRASSGENFLGGEDITRAMAHRVLEARGLTFERVEMGMPRLLARLLQQCEAAKCRLSRQDATPVRIPDRNGELHDGAPEVVVTRQDLERWTESILARVESPIRRALGDAKLRKDDIHQVILVGGATRMPLVIDRVTALLGKDPQRRLNPDEVVGLGAAVQAGLIACDESVEDLVVTDVAPFTLGMEISKKLGHELRRGYFMPVLPRNTFIPASRVERVYTLTPNQTSITIKIYQGESRRVEDNLFLGEFEASGVPLGPAGQEVDVRFTYDLNGVLEVEATIVETKKKVQHIVTKHAHGLTRDQVARAVRDMEKLKTHPREETVNRFLLLRANRLYQELPIEIRTILGELLDGFEAALNLQEEGAIQRHREALQEFLDRYDGEGPGEEDADDWYRP